MISSLVAKGFRPVCSNAVVAFISTSPVAHCGPHAHKWYDTALPSWRVGSKMKHLFSRLHLLKLNIEVLSLLPTAASNKVNDPDRNQMAKLRNLGNSSKFMSCTIDKLNNYPSYHLDYLHRGILNRTGKIVICINNKHSY